MKKKMKHTHGHIAHMGKVTEAIVQKQVVLDAGSLQYLVVK
jgi:hypothetical protein